MSPLYCSLSTRLTETELSARRFAYFGVASSVRRAVAHWDPRSSWIVGSKGQPASSASLQDVDKQEVEERALQALKRHNKIAHDKLTSTAHFANDLGLDSWMLSR